MTDRLLHCVPWPNVPDNLPLHPPLQRVLPVDTGSFAIHELPPDVTADEPAARFDRRLAVIFRATLALRTFQFHRELTLRAFLVHGQWLPVIPVALCSQAPSAPALR